MVKGIKERKYIKKSYLDTLIKNATFYPQSHLDDPKYELIVISEEQLVNGVLEINGVVNECKIQLKKGELALLNEQKAMGINKIILPLGLENVVIDLEEQMEEVKYINLGYVAETYVRELNEICSYKKCDLLPGEKDCVSEH